MTQDKRKALEALLEKVEACNCNHGSFAAAFIYNDPDDHNCVEKAINANRAYGGSLDAAKSLHDAVLPGWVWCIDDSCADVFRNSGAGGFSAISAKNPARAWLIAILKALIAQEQA